MTSTSGSWADNPASSILTEAMTSTLTSYHGEVAGKLRRLQPRTEKPAPLASLAYAAIAGMIDSDHFPCVAARSVRRRSTIRFGLYPAMTSEATTLALLGDLWRFSTEFSSVGEQASFIAAFSDPTPASEEEFEALLWRQLQELHDADSAVFDWDETVDSDPQAADFSFSVAGRGHFVVGLHASASRWSRRFSWPTLVFNPHAQFEELRRTGRLERMKAVIRQRDHRLQGSLNPMLADHGASSEALQYSGRQVEPTWRCPFVPQANRTSAEGAA